ncbi:hypothetical protein [Natronobacterium haloterrestre]|uniref:hypothetical protein n=1 Tax=Natronobacterium haloterrestre TaxID=148448 RepID=UPI0011609750|nr:hypothetical protein [Halobiforma haloterrestris]
MSNQNQNQSGHHLQTTGIFEEDDEDPITEDDVGVVELYRRLESFSGQLDDFRETLQAERARREQLESQLNKSGNRLNELEEEIRRLDARTDLLELVESADEMDGKQRAIALIQHLKRAAEREQDRGRDAKSSVNREDAEAALHHPDVDRTTIYDDMRRAARLVDDESILWYESKSGGESRLKLNLEEGNLPSQVISQDVSHGGR